MTEEDKALVEELMNMKASRHCQVLKALARIRELSAENERMREQLSGISGRLEAMRVALIHTAGICNPLSGFLKNVTGLRKKHLDSVQAIASAALGEQQ